MRLKSCALHLWETPTWELTMDPEAHFARGCDAVLFVMDCTRRQTVDEVLLHWMHLARYHCAAQERGSRPCGASAGALPLRGHEE